VISFFNAVLECILQNMGIREHLHQARSKPEEKQHKEKIFVNVIDENLFLSRSSKLPVGHSVVMLDSPVMNWQTRSPKPEQHSLPRSAEFVSPSHCKVKISPARFLRPLQMSWHFPVSSAVNCPVLCMYEVCVLPSSFRETGAFYFEIEETL